MTQHLKQNKMKKISDYFGTKTAIKCENEQQWNKLKELYCATARSFNWEYPCFSLEHLGGQCRETYPDFKILPYSDFVSDVPELVGVEMEVSDDGENWNKRLVYGHCELGYIFKSIIDSVLTAEHARPIQPKKVLTATLQELAEKLGVDEIQLK